MKYIDEAKIEGLLHDSRRMDDAAFEAILSKAKSLKRLSLDETAALLAAEEPERKKKILEAAAFVKEAIYGKRVVLFVPLYISNFCVNTCAYCSFKHDNVLLERKALGAEEIKKEVDFLLSRGHKRILMVAGESAPPGRSSIDYYLESIRAIYSVSRGANRIRRVNVNCAPLGREEFKELKSVGIGTYQLFQETYHERTYRAVHPKGPKSDPDNRIEAVERAFEAGIDDVGVGVLYGLYDYRFETLALLMHVEALEKKFGVGPHTISVPRIEPALGTDFARRLPHKLTDDAFKQVVAVLRLSVPYTGMILSTREPAALRDELFCLGISQASAESNTAPGGYVAAASEQGAQFTLGDHRSLDEVIGSLLSKALMPSFCTACYRKQRTGAAFMHLAKPGTIKGKCNINALVTLKEYLDDFASEEVKRSGYRLIQKAKADLDETSRRQLSRFFEQLDSGLRDKYV